MCSREHPVCIDESAPAEEGWAEDEVERVRVIRRHVVEANLPPDFLALKHESRILGHSSNPACGFYMMEQVRLCAVRPMENWIDSSLNQIQGRTTVRESYSRALDQGPLIFASTF